MFCHDSFRRRWVASALAGLTFAGCSRPSDTPPAPSPASVPAQPVVPASQPTNLEASAPPPEAAPVVEAATPHVEAPPSEPNPAPEPPPRSPYEGLSVEQVFLYKRIEGLLEPVASLSVEAYKGLKESERQAEAIAKIGAFNVSLNRDAEKRIRDVLTAATKADELAMRHASDSQRLWARDENGDFIGRAALVAAYEKALDDGEEFPLEIRRALGEMARSGEMPFPGFEVELDHLTRTLRTQLVGQSVTGDTVFLMAHALSERGQAVVRRREWMRSMHRLVDALPPKYRTVVLMPLAWDFRQQSEYERKRKALVTKDFPVEVVFSREAREDYAKKLEGIATERRAGLLALERERRDGMESFFSKLDEPGWQALVSLDDGLSELQKVIDAIDPTVEYRFRPLLPADASREAADNVLSKLPIPGSAEESVPTVEVRNLDIVFDSPAGQPKFNDVVKPGQVLAGDVHLKARFEPPLDMSGVELQITDIKRGEFTGELRIPKDPLTSLPKTMPIKGEVDGAKLLFRLDWEPLGPTGSSLEFEATVEEGSLVAKTVGYGSVEGYFSLAPKK